ncbi:MAG: MerC domain-containing protein, partial [Bacteroidota bacterium]
MNSSPAMPALTERPSFWDRVGIGVSALCAVHCLAVPLVAVTLPFWFVEASHEWVHVVLALVLVPVTLIAMRHAHGRRSVLALLGAGMALVVSALLLPEGAEMAVTLIGSLLLIAGHTMNWSA